MLGLLVTKFSFSRWPGCSFDSTCYNEILEFHFVSVRLMVFAGPASDRILVLQIRFVVLTEPAADEILELHFARLMVLLGLPTPDCEAYGLCPLPTDEIVGLHLVRLSGLDWTCHGHNFGTPD